MTKVLHSGGNHGWSEGTLMEWEGMLAGCVCDKSLDIRIKKKKTKANPDKRKYGQ